jgi:hypothetical protein
MIHMNNQGAYQMFGTRITIQKDSKSDDASSHRECQQSPEPAKNGVLATLSPLTIMTGGPNPDYNDMKIEFGVYAQVFEANDPTDTVREPQE